MTREDNNNNEIKNPPYQHPALDAGFKPYLLIRRVNAIDEPVVLPERDFNTIAHNDHPKGISV